jgi:hypothetical protein
VGLEVDGRRKDKEKRLSQKAAKRENMRGLVQGDIRFSGSLIILIHIIGRGLYVSTYDSP